MRGKRKEIKLFRNFLMRVRKEIYKTEFNNHEKIYVKYQKNVLIVKEKKIKQIKSQKTAYNVK